jgi:phenylpropionate dioxygenase-like ring-hydroxylating dioxygenase large terminal subunit
MGANFLDPDSISALVEPGRVHRRVYSDPAIFELEMERIFGRAWLFVGHASQVSQPGDYVTMNLGREPVIFTRHRDGTLKVLQNRCAHRGPKVLNERCGHRNHFTCLYHGWTYDTDGALVHVPVPEGCSVAFDKSHFGLAQVPRVGEYRGFVFASFASSGVSFDEHIASVRGNIDDLVDRAPAGEIAFDAGMHRYIYRGNWKLQVENVLDSYHVPYSHASTVNRKGEQFARREGDATGAKVVEGNKASADWTRRKSYTVGRGHGWTSNTALDDGKRTSAVYSEYKRVLAERVGADRAAHILTPRLHNTLVYPNASIMGLNIHVRVIKPLAVDLTEVNIYPVRLVGAPDEMNFRNIRLLNVTHAAASFVQSDDLESFTRAQAGLASLMNDWVDISRGLGAEEADESCGGARGLATHEMAVRAQYAAWRDYMCEATP